MHRCFTLSHISRYYCLRDVIRKQLENNIHHSILTVDCNISLSNDDCFTENPGFSLVDG